MSKNISGMLKQAQKLQSDMLKMQEELAEKVVEASSGGGMITSKVNGKQELISIDIDKTVVNPANRHIFFLLYDSDEDLN